MVFVPDLGEILAFFSSEGEVDSYDQDYQEITSFVRSLDDDRDTLALHAVYRIAYSWMPTILKRIDDNGWGRHAPTSAFAAIRGVGTFDDALNFVHSMSFSPVNNSWIGLSKVLHFINPAFFPIWDSRVARMFGLRQPYAFNSKNSYLTYVSFIDEVDTDTRRRASDLVNAKLQAAGLEMVTSIRAIERVLFFAGRDS